MNVPPVSIWREKIKSLLHARPLRMTAKRLSVGFCVSAFIAGSGLFVFFRSVSAGDPYGMFVGLTGVGVGYVATLLLRMFAEILAITRAGRASGDRHLRMLRRLSRRLELAQRGGGAPGATLLDLSEFGPGRVDDLTAATLDRSVFPRLAVTLPDEDDHHDESADPSVAVSAGVTNKNIYRQWQRAVAEQDILTCRAIHATLAEALDPEVLAPLTTQMEEIEQAVESSLRRDFTEALQDRDYAAAIRTGERICEFFPDRRAAADFRRLKPLLDKRVI